jgi:hypothetical protein
LACRVLLKIAYLLTCRVLGLAVLVFRGDPAKDAELLVLRHENAVLRRHAGRLRYEPADRAWFATLAAWRRKAAGRRPAGCATRWSTCSWTPATPCGFQNSATGLDLGLRCPLVLVDEAA